MAGPIRGRGASGNPPNRFETLSYLPDPAERDPEDPGPSTVLLRDTSRSIIAYNDSPDVGFSASINPYRGCEHGCIYCYARPFHEFLGYSAGLDFETTILVKEDAPELLRAELSSPRWKPQVIAMSGATDPYQPAERRLRITRRCLEVLAEFRNPVSIITKNHLVTRDVDLLADLAADHAAHVNISVTTLREDLRRVMEPRTSTPARRLAAIETLAAAGVPVRVMVAPVIPGLNDVEVPSIIEAAASAGARAATWIPVRLPHAVADLFQAWLSQHFPERKEKVLNRIRDVRGGKLDETRFGERMRGGGIFAEQIGRLFDAACRRAGIGRELPPLSSAAFRRPGEAQQLGLFDLS